LLILYRSHKAADCWTGAESRFSSYFRFGWGR